MAGPWFVDPENGLTTNDGLSEDTPWQLIPGQTGATAQTGYGVVAGDTINIKNGTTTALRVVFPANNLTYRGYGVADNVLELTLPHPRNPARTYLRRVARKWGAHEGMWKVNAPTETLSIINFVGRSGCVIEDCHVTGPLSETVISIGTSSLVGVGATVRRCRVTESDRQGVQAYTTAVTYEDVLIEDIDEDACTLASSTANSYRAGTTDTVRRVSILNAGRDTVAAVGDAFQTLVATNRFESALLMEDVYVYKENTTKQALVFGDVLGGLTLRRFHLANGGTGSVQILSVGIGAATWVMENGYIQGGGNANASFRLDSTQGIETGAAWTIRNVIAPNAMGGLFTIGSSNGACTVDGDITIANCYSDGVNSQGLSFSGDISAHAGANVTLGVNATLRAVNNVLLGTGAPAIRLPSGGANAAAWSVQTNATHSATFAIGSTSYATVALFEAAHSAATDNIDADPMLSASYAPKSGSPLLGAGTFISYAQRDIEGKQRPNPPSIGAYDRATMRAT